MTKIRTSVAAVALLALAGCGASKKHTPVLGDRVPILASESDVAVDKNLADVPVTLPAAVANTEWTQSGGNAAKSMGNLAFDGSLTTAWTARISGDTSRTRLAAAPVVADDRLFVMDTDGFIHAFDVKTGNEIWSVSTTDKSDEAKRAIFGGGVSFNEGKLYATNGLGDVLALDAGDGSVIWRKKPGAPLRGAPTVSNGNIYVLSQDNQLFVLNQESGDQIWNQSGSIETQGVFGVAAPAAGRGSVIAGFSSGELNAYRYENGASLWADTLSRTSISTSVSSLADIDADPVIDGDQVFAIGAGGRMVAVDILTGRRLWEQNISGIKTPWVAGNWIYVVTENSKLLAIARDSGKIRWIAELPAYRSQKKKKGPIFWSGPVMAGGRLYLVSSRGNMLSVDPADGSIGAAQEIGKSFSFAPVVADGMMFTLSNDGRITAFR